MITFTCPDFPGLTIRTDDRVVKFAGGVLVASNADAEAVFDFAAAHPEYGVQPTRETAPQRKRARARKPAEKPAEETTEA